MSSKIKKSESRENVTERKEGRNMALQKARLKEILSEAGCDTERISDAVEQILSGHGATVDALKETITNLQTELESAKASQKELEDLKKTNGDIASLQKEYDDYKASVEAEKTRARKESAYKDILKDVGVPEMHFAKILKYSPVDEVEFDDEGNVKDSDKIRKAILDDWSDHIEKKEVFGQQTPTPPKNDGSKTTMTKEQIRAIPDAQARQKAMIENASLFGLADE